MDRQPNEIVLVVKGDTYNNRDTALRKLQELAAQNRGRPLPMPIPGDFMESAPRVNLECRKYMFGSPEDLSGFKGGLGKLSEELASSDVTIEEPKRSTGREATIK